jgi:hypothetical protein
MVAYAVLVGLLGLCMVASQLTKRFRVELPIVIVIMAVLLFWNNGAEGWVLLAKIALAIGSLFVAIKWPELSLGILSIACIADLAMQMQEIGYTKTTQLPSIYLLLAGAALYRNRIASMIVLSLAIAAAATNALFLQLRGDALLIAIFVCLSIAWNARIRSLTRYFVYLPIALGILYFIIGSQLGSGATYASLRGIEIDATASNFERSFFSYVILSEIQYRPLGIKLTDFVDATVARAADVGRIMYSETSLDPHNHFLYFVAMMGVVGVGMWFFYSWKLSGVVAIASRSVPYLACVPLLTAICIIASLYTFATIERLVLSSCAGALVGLVSRSSRARPQRSSFRRALPRLNAERWPGKSEQRG